jgi:hypothetical protein
MQKDLRALILRRLAIVPMSLTEICDGSRCDPGQVRQSIRALIEEKLVVRMEAKGREGGPFYCLATYQEEKNLPDFSIPYDYSSHYENQLDDNQDGTFSGIRSW